MTPSPGSTIISTAGGRTTSSISPWRGRPAGRCSISAAAPAWRRCAWRPTGFEVTGADPSLSMLAVARSREGTERVRWVHATGQDLDLAQRFALIYMTGHAFQALLTDEDAVAVLRNAGRHLAPGGRLAFDTRNPAVREWLTWNASGMARGPANPRAWGGEGSGEGPMTRRRASSPSTMSTASWIMGRSGAPARASASSTSPISPG